MDSCLLVGLGSCKKCGNLRKLGELRFLPSGTSAELPGEKLSDARGHLDRRLGIEEERARAPGQDVVDRAGHLVTCRPDNLRARDRKRRVELLAQLRLFIDQFLDADSVRAIDRRGRRSLEHFDAFDHLAPGAACAGKAYFISNGEPLPMRELLNALLDAAGAPRAEKSLSFKAAYRIGVVCETLWTVLPLKGEPPMTRFLAEQLSTSHWYDMAPARRDFGYVPQVSFNAGLTKLKESLQANKLVTRS